MNETNKEQNKLKELIFKLGWKTNLEDQQKLYLIQQMKYFSFNYQFKFLVKLVFNKISNANIAKGYEFDTNCPVFVHKFLNENVLVWEASMNWIIKLLAYKFLL